MTFRTQEESKLQQYSSLIGIITAIVGNILISFALNIQRYAHIRLGQEREEESKAWKSGKDKSDGGYGTQTSGGSGASNGGSGSVGQEQYHDEDSDGEANETDPLTRRPQALSGSSDSQLTFQDSSNAEKQSGDASQKTYLRSPYWWAGILLMTVGEAGNFIAYGFAPASIVSPLGVVALVSNCVIAPYILKERFRQRDFWGVVVAVGGAVTVVLSAKTSETKLGPNEIWGAITRWEFELYLGITIAAMITLMWASSRYGEKSILIDLGLVGLFGGYTALSTKGIASLLSYSLWRVVTFPVTYLLVAILVATAVLQIRYVNRALQRFDSTQVIPTQFVLFTISVIVGSAVLYRDFEQADAGRVGKFIGGCILTFLGVYLITSGRDRGGDEQKKAFEEAEEGPIALVDDEDQYHDDVDEEEDQSARRESKVQDQDGEEGSEPRHLSFQLDGPQSTPQTPKRLPSNASQTPSITFTPSLSSQSREDPSSSPLLDNPWQSSEERLAPPNTQPPRLQSTSSTPVLPSSVQADLPERPFTPRAKSHAPQPPTPASSSRSDRPSMLSRNSMSRMLPGPLISPLSSSLSAIVADSLRRGVETSPSQQRRPGGLRNSKSQRLPRHSIAAPSTSGTSGRRTGSPLKPTRRDASADADAGQVAAEGAESGKPRAKSFSATIGDMFRGKREKSSSNSDEDSEEPL